MLCSYYPLLFLLDQGASSGITEGLAQRLQWQDPFSCLLAELRGLLTTALNTSPCSARCHRTDLEQFESGEGWLIPVLSSLFLTCPSAPSLEVLFKSKEGKLMRIN